MLQLLGIVPSQEGAILPKPTYSSKNASHFLRQAPVKTLMGQPKGPPEPDCGVRGLGISSAKKSGIRRIKC